MSTHARIFGAAAVIALGACGGTADGLHPAPRADKVLGQRATAEAFDDDTRITVQTGAWPGEAAIEEHVTPLLVTVRNGSEEPLRFSYSSFVLQGHDASYAALPPFEIEGRAASDDALANARWERTAFVPAPYYRAYQPGAKVLVEPFEPDAVYHREHYPQWRGTEALPTPEMLEWALPEGVIEPGGYVSGYLYFEPVADDESDVRFRAHLRSAETGMEIVNVSIPLMVLD